MSARQKALVRAIFKVSGQQREPSSAALARRLDLEADVELQLGHHLAAERLSVRAAQLREAGHAAR